jgi:hypothetical protein
MQEIANLTDQKESRKMKRFILSVIFTASLMLFAMTLNAQNVAELSASKNNTLYESAEGDLSNGKGVYIFSGTTATGDIRRTLLQFDLSEIPQGAKIESVELLLEMNKTISGPMSMSLHEVLTAWGEGASDAGGEEGGGGDALEGDATWTNTFFPDQNWENAGGDYISSAVSSVDVDGSGIYTWTTTLEFTTLVQKWLDSPEENFGLILIGNESETGTAKRFSSRHNPDEEFRPVLVVEYTAEATSTDVIAELPGRIELNQNYPNPFNPSTVISFSVPEVTNVEIAVHDMLGRKIRTLADGRFQAGSHDVTFDASELSSGVYIYTLRSGGQMHTRRLTVLK